VHNVYLAGDYTASDYPATLEAAVRSGVACARMIVENS
jgi:hydroxysqualene dehydroxylase